MFIEHRCPIRPEVPCNRFILSLLNRALAGNRELRHFWYDLSKLPAGASPDAFLSIFGKIRDTRELHEDVGLYLIARQVKRVTEYRLAEQPGSLNNSDRPTDSNGSPPAATTEAGTDAIDPAHVFADTLREYGEEALAERYENQLADFQRAYANGFRLLCQSSQQFDCSCIPGPWIEDLLDAVLSVAVSDRDYTELKCSICNDGTLPTLTLHFFLFVMTDSHHAEDTTRGANVEIQLKTLIDLLDEVESVSWEAKPFTRRYGVSMRIIGLYYNERVAVQILYVPFPITSEASSERATDCREGTEAESGR